MTPEQSAALRKPFDAKTIGKLPKKNNHTGQTIQLDFVGHAAVTDRLLAVDPDWYWEPMATDERGLPAYDNAGGLWIRLFIGGTMMIGYGDGPDPKQRVGDALRNAAMRKGVALDLWSRQELEGIDPNGGDAAQKTRTPEQYRDKHGGTLIAPDSPPVETPAVSGSVSDSLPEAEPTAVDPETYTAQQVEAIRERVIAALGEKKADAARLMTRVQLDASKAKLMQQPTTTPKGEPTTVAVLLDEACKVIARAAL